MECDNSYAQIKINKSKQIIFHVVNESFQQFQIYAEPLLNVWENKGEYVRIKRKDNKPDKSKMYYPGEVFALINNSEDSTECVTLTLFIGAPYQKLKFTNGPENVIEMHQYHFPESEFKEYMNVLDSMTSQQQTFEQLLASSDVYSNIKVP